MTNQRERYHPTNPRERKVVGWCSLSVAWLAWWSQLMRKGCETQACGPPCAKHVRCSAQAPRQDEFSTIPFAMRVVKSLIVEIIFSLSFAPSTFACFATSASFRPMSEWPNTPETSSSAQSLEAIAVHLILPSGDVGGQVVVSISFSSSFSLCLSLSGRLGGGLSLFIKGERNSLSWGGWVVVSLSGERIRGRP